jgi:hypothetical protein
MSFSDSAVAAVLVSVMVTLPRYAGYGMLQMRNDIFYGIAYWGNEKIPSCVRNVVHGFPIRVDGQGDTWNKQ